MCRRKREPFVPQGTGQIDGPHVLVVTPIYHSPLSCLHYPGSDPQVIYFTHSFCQRTELSDYFPPHGPHCLASSFFLGNAQTVGHRPANPWNPYLCACFPLGVVKSLDAPQHSDNLFFPLMQNLRQKPPPRHFTHRTPGSFLDSSRGYLHKGMNTGTSQLEAQIHFNSLKRNCRV